MTKTQTAQAARILAAVVATQGEYEGKPTLGIGPEGASYRANLTAGAGKWARLFTTDGEGDSNLLNVLLFLSDNSEDFAEVSEGADAFVRQYLSWRADHYDSDNSDLVGTVARTEEAEPAPAITGVEMINHVRKAMGSVGATFESIDSYRADIHEVAAELARMGVVAAAPAGQGPSHHEVIAASEELAQLCRGQAVPEVISVAVARDFEASCVGMDDYLAAMAEFAKDGDVFSFLGEAGYPGKDGELLGHSEDAPRGYATKAANAWRKLAAPKDDACVAAEPVAVRTEPVTTEPVTTEPVMSDAARRHYSAECSKLPIWRTGDARMQQRLVEEVFHLVQHDRVRWSEVRSGLGVFATISDYFASVS